VQARLVDGRVAGVPSADSGHVSVHNGDLDVRVLEGNDCGGRATCSTGRVSISIGITTRPRSSSPKQQPSRRSESTCLLPAVAEQQLLQIMRQGSDYIPT
jgi:hypothetical protein